MDSTAHLGEGVKTLLRVLVNPRYAVDNGDVSPLHVEYHHLRGGGVEISCHGDRKPIRARFRSPVSTKGPAHTLRLELYGGGGTAGCAYFQIRAAPLTTGICCLVSDQGCEIER